MSAASSLAHLLAALGALCRLAGFGHFCRLGTIATFSVHRHGIKAINYSSLAKRSKKADRWASLAAVQSDPLETALAAALAAMTTFPSIAAPIV